MKYNKAAMNTAVVVVMGGVATMLLGVLALGFVILQQKDTAQVVEDESQYELPRSIVSDLGVEKEIHDYLKEKVAISSFGDEVFCSFEVLGDEKVDDEITLYLWTLCSELYVVDGQIKEGGGVSEPLVLKLKKTGFNYAVIEHKEPVAGAGYAQSARELFPEEYHTHVLPDKVTPQQFNDRHKLLSYWVEQQGKAFYGVR